MKERRRCGEVRRCGLPRARPGPASRCPDAGQLRRSPAFARTRRPGRCRVLVAADAPDERVSFGRAPDFFPGADSGTPTEALPRAIALPATRTNLLVGHVRASRWGLSSSRDSGAKRRGVEPVQDWIGHRHAVEIALPHRRSLGRARRRCVSSTSRALRHGADRRLPLARLFSVPPSSDASLPRPADSSATSSPLPEPVCWLAARARLIAGPVLAQSLPLMHPERRSLRRGAHGLSGGAHRGRRIAEHGAQGVARPAVGSAR